MSRHNPIPTAKLIVAFVVLAGLRLMLVSPLLAQEKPPAGEPAAGPVKETSVKVTRVTIAEGEVPVREFLKFLAVFSDMPILVSESQQVHLDREISIIAPIEDADEVIVRAILEVNGWRVYTETLENGNQILRISLENEPPERIVKVFQIEWAQAHELSEWIRRYLSASRPQIRRTTTTSRSRTSSRTATSTGTRTREPYFIADQRTNKIIAIAYSEQDLEDIEMLIGELDVKRESPPRMMIYTTRSQRASDLAMVLTNLFSVRKSTRPTTTTSQRTSSGPLFVPYEPTNTLIIKADDDTYKEILMVLNILDKEKANEESPPPPPEESKEDAAESF